MFEAYTYDYLLADVLKNAPPNIDTRQGSIFFDAVAAITLKIAKYYTDLDVVLKLAMLETTSGECLDLKAAEYGLKRQQAIKACYFVSFEGTTPEIGERFFTDGLYFSLKQDDKGVYYLEHETPGIIGNNVYEGTPAIPVKNIVGLKSAAFGAIYVYGAENEDDESLRNRVKEKIAGPAENGNKQHYKTWCESVDGVGRARIFPLWNGPNTVKGVLIDSEGKPCTEAKAAEVQNYIDPATKGLTATVDGKTYIVGDGLGNGVANIGAHFTAVGANSLSIDVTFEAELVGGATKDAVEQEAKEAIEKYFRELVMTADEAQNVIVRISSIGAMLSQLKNLLDYYNLRLNGDIYNITAGENDVPVLGKVSIE